MLRLREAREYPGGETDHLSAHVCSIIGYLLSPADHLLGQRVGGGLLFTQHQVQEGSFERTEQRAASTLRVLLLGAGAERPFTGSCLKTTRVFCCSFVFRKQAHGLTRVKHGRLRRFRNDGFGEDNRGISTLRLFIQRQGS